MKPVAGRTATGQRLDGDKDETVTVAASFHSDRSWRFDVPPDRLWDRINSTSEYPSWWPWLREFDGAGPIAEGGRWTCAVSPPLPYTVRFVVEFRRVKVGRAVESEIHGDIAGWAHLTIDDRPDGSSARLVSALRPTNLLLWSVGSVARPLVQYGHDWILDEGRRQFVTRAFDD